MVFQLASLCFAFMFVKRKNYSVLPHGITILLPPVVYPACSQDALIAADVHGCAIVGCAAHLSIYLAVACCNCGFWSSAEACNGGRGSLLWPVAV